MTELNEIAQTVYNHVKYHGLNVGFSQVNRETKQVETANAETIQINMEGKELLNTIVEQTKKVLNYGDN